MSQNGSVEIYLLNANGGKTTKAFEQLINAEKEVGQGKAVLISANRILADKVKEKYFSESLSGNTSESENLALSQPNSRTLLSLSFAIAKYAELDAEDEDSDSVSPQFLTGAETTLLIEKTCDEMIDANFEKLSHGQLKLTGFISKLRDFIETARDLRILPEDLAKSESPIWRDMAKILEKYEEILKREFKFDRSKLIENAVAEIEKDDFKIPYQTVIVDDAQNLTHLGIYLLQKLSEKGVDLVLFGNPDQTTEDFRGGVGNFAQFFPNALIKEKTVQTNRAVSETIFETVSSLKSLENENQAINLVTFDNYSTQIAFVVSKIRKAILEEGAKPSDFALISRNAFSLLDAKSKLTQAKIPHSQLSTPRPIKNGSLFKSFFAIFDAAESEKIVSELTKQSNVLTRAGVSFDELKITAKETIENGLPASRALWKVWESAGVASGLQTDAIESETPESANEILDSAIYIFEQARRIEANDSQISPNEFLKFLSNQTSSADNYQVQLEKNAVQLLTPSSALSEHFKTVFILDLNEGIFPNLKLRDSILNTTDLIQISQFSSNSQFSPSRFSDKIAAIHQSEQRLLFTSLTRGEKVWVLAKNNDTEIPSVYFNMIAQAAETETESVQYDEEKHGKIFEFTLNALSIKLRKHALENGDFQNETVNILKFLQDENVRSANSKNWFFSNDNSEISSSPLIESAEQFVKDKNTGQIPEIRLSPSSIEDLHKCPLKWLFEFCGGKDTTSSDAASFGTLIHECAERVPELVENDADKTTSELRKIATELWNETEYDSEFTKAITKNKIEEFLPKITDYYLENDKNGRRVAKDENGVALVEIKAKTTIGNIGKTKIVLSGKIDRIEKDEDAKMFVVDWKTGKTKWKPSGEITQNLQTLAYRLMLKNNEAGEKIETDGADVVYLGNQNKSWKSRTHSSKINGSELEIIEKEFIDKTLEILSGNTFAASGNQHGICRYCPLKNACVSDKLGGDILK